MVIKKITNILFVTCLVMTLGFPKHGNNSVDFHVESLAKQHEATKCLMLCIGNNEQLSQAAKIIQYDLEFSDQLKVDLKRSDKELGDRELEKLVEKDVPLCIYLKHEKNAKTKNKELHVQVKNVIFGDIVLDRWFSLSKKHKAYSVHKASDAIFPVLTNTKGPMLSSLAYCELDFKTKNKSVIVSDYAGFKKKVVVAPTTINVAPCWHSQKIPMLFYSRFTSRNCELISLNLEKKYRSTVCSYDGLNLQPSFSLDGVKAALCLSGGGNSEVYLYDQRLCNHLGKRVFKQLTFNKGNNSSPSLLPDGNLVFCSDYQSNLVPQIYHMNTTTKKVKRLTKGSYSAAPTYCSKTNSIIYTKLVKGFKNNKVHNVFQLFSLCLDKENPQEQQLTFNDGDKLEPTASDCGNYIAFSYYFVDKKVNKMSQQIASLNINSGRIRVLTSGREPKSFPAWKNAPFYQLI